MSEPYQGQSADPSVPGIIGENTAGQNSVGVKGIVQNLGWGVLGESTTGTGVVGLSQTSYAIYAKSESASALLAESTNADGVFGVSHSANAVGVSGHNDTGTAVWGGSKDGRGVVGISTTQNGVEGTSTNGDGVFGRSLGTGRGVVGVSADHTGVEGNSTKGSGVFGSSQSNPGVEGHSTTGAGIFGKGTPAGFFDGNVIITGTLTAQGVPLAALLAQIQQLEHQVLVLTQIVNAKYPPSSTGSGAAPFIEATIELGTIGGIENQILTVSGGGFNPLEPITIHVVYSTNGGNSASFNQSTTADSLGMMKYSQSVTCVSGQTTTYAIQATGNSSHKTSNNAGASC